MIVQEPLPFSTELCVALVRLLHNLKGLRARGTPGPGQADEDSLLAFCTQVITLALQLLHQRAWMLQVRRCCLL